MKELKNPEVFVSTVTRDTQVFQPDVPITVAVTSGGNEWKFNGRYFKLDYSTQQLLNWQLTLGISQCHQDITVQWQILGISTDRIP